VYFTGETTIYEGMPVCYDYDTTDNWLGVASVDFTTTASSVTESGTTAEGAQNEGKFIRVERPSASNLGHFAGVVAGADHAGETGPKAIDIYIPNGAVVPVRCDVDTTTGVTILAMTSGEEELGFLAADSRPIAIAMEDETGLDGTAGLTLAVLNPDLFSFNYGTSSSAYAESPGTYPVNYQYVEFTSTAPAVAYLQDNRVLYNVAMASGQVGVCNNYLHFTGSNTAGADSYIRGGVTMVHLDGCTINSAGVTIAGLCAQAGGTPTLLTVNHVCALWADYGVGKVATGHSEVIQITNTSNKRIDQMLYFRGQYCRQLFELAGATSGGDNGCVKDCTGTMTVSGDDKAIKITIDGDIFYLIAVDSIPSG